MKRPAAVRRGRPPKQHSGKIEASILDAATELFLSDGYGATSIEAVSQRIGISKRTFYSRFNGKAALFTAVIERLVSRMRPPPEVDIFHGGPLEEMLLRLAGIILHASLSPQAIALQRVMLAEVTRFPELSVVLASVGARQEAIDGIAQLLCTAYPALQDHPHNAAFAATQFIHLIVAEPQRRALGLGVPLTSAQQDRWVRDCIALFLRGLGAVAEDI
jgi:AcrR family transcriptional regulator